ncbi:MAG TPA: hypothetical protein DCY86_06305 [Bdellovibrionales bacterium]|nr:hypothetical protein [Bdellovibrionales bacterium]
MANLGNNFALVSNGTGDVSVSAVTATELGYVSGVTSAIQTQLGARVLDTGDTMTGVLTMGAANGVKFNNAGNTFGVTIDGSQATGNYTIKLPAAVPGGTRYLESDATGVLTWVAGMAPTGAAGGDLTGNYPNPTIGSDKVTSTHIFDGTIANIDVSATAAITFDKMANLGNNFALVSNGTGDVSVSAVTATELGYVSGVTSAIQTQFSGKQATLVNSAGLAGALSDETGTGVAVFSVSPSFTTPSLGAATATSLTVNGSITGTTTLAIGNGGTASNGGNGSIAAGYGAIASGSSSAAFGYNAQATAGQTVALGINSLADTSMSVAIGLDANTSGNYEIALGGASGSYVTTGGNLTVGGDLYVTDDVSLGGSTVTLITGLCTLRTANSASTTADWWADTLVCAAGEYMISAFNSCPSTGEMRGLHTSSFGVRYVATRCSITGVHAVQAMCCGIAR